eukprot:467389_1
MAQYCKAYVLDSSPWSRGKCKNCNHPKEQHGNNDIAVHASFDSNTFNTTSSTKSTANKNDKSNKRHPVSTKKNVVAASDEKKNIDSMSFIQLKALAASMDLSTGGTKKQLLSRLRKHLYPNKSPDNNTAAKPQQAQQFGKGTHDADGGLNDERKEESKDESQIAAFLSGLELKEYIAAFEENKFKTVSELKDLTKDDLIDLGVVAMAHRKTILRGIKALLNAEQKHDDDDDMKTHECRNALIICLGIAKYTKLMDLNTANDIQKYRALFQDKYGYKMIANDPSKPMNKEEMIRFLRNARNGTLYDFINDKLNYDGLIVTFGGHGTYDSIICSDGSHYKHQAMRRIFLIEELKQIPKIFLIDACRSEVEDGSNRQAFRGSSTAATFSTTLMTSEGHKVRGAQICKYITGKLRDIHHSDVYKDDFRRVYLAAKKQIRMNSEQDLVLCEHDTAVECVVFVPKEEERGTRNKRYQADMKQTSTAAFGHKFLKDIGMEQYYESIFKPNKLDDEASLKGLNEHKLKKLGIWKVSDRDKIMNAIRKLQ